MLAEEVTTQQLEGAQNEGDKEDECADDDASDWEDSDAPDEKTLFERLDLQHVCSRRSLLTTMIRDADSRHRNGPSPPPSESENLERISEESRTISQQLDTSTSPKSLISLCSDDRSSLIMPVLKVPASTHIDPRAIRQKCLRDELPVYLRECLLRERLDKMDKLKANGVLKHTGKEDERRINGSWNNGFEEYDEYRVW